jgi:hypothetical protein
MNIIIVNISYSYVNFYTVFVFTGLLDEQNYWKYTSCQREGDFVRIKIFCACNHQ